MYATTIIRLARATVVNHIVQYSRKVNKRILTGRPLPTSLVKHGHEAQQEDSDYEDIEDADFMNINQSHREYLTEEQKFKQQTVRLTVREKYFKQKLPNFLTWSDKEQIRYLFNKHPEEWTIPKLSEGFPATPNIIAKIVKAKWTKQNDRKLKAHDSSVQRNWVLFKEGKLKNLPSFLVEHLNKFTNREFHSSDYPDSNVFRNNKEKPKPFTKNINIGTEFADIITSYEKLKSKKLPEQEDELKVLHIEGNLKHPQNETYLLTNPKQYSDKKHVTLNMLHELQSYGPDSEEVADRVVVKQIGTDSNILEKLNEVNDISNAENEIIDLTQNKYCTTGKVSTSVQGLNQEHSFLTYPEKITIPQKKRKSGYTYKLNDCYYDDDGLFLYRVPGMY